MLGRGTKVGPWKAVNGLPWLGFWTLLGIFDATETCLRNAFQDQQVAWHRALILGLALWYGWAILALAVFRLARRFPLEQRFWARQLAVHLVAGVFFAEAKLCMDYPIVELFYCQEPGWMPFATFFRTAFSGYFHRYYLIYLAMLGVAHAFNYYRQSEERELKATRLEARLARVQLHLLKSQLHPHFLFNTLNAISALIHSEVEAADQMLARLGDLLRLSLDFGESHEVKLREELRFLHCYMEIEKVRFGPRLTLQTTIEPEVLRAHVPFMILQPLVENAIRHGISKLTGPGCVVVRASQDLQMLRLEVEDNGVGLSSADSGQHRTGLGLRNTRDRLRQLYGDDHQFELGRANAGGVLVKLLIPFRVETSEPFDAALETV